MKALDSMHASMLAELANPSCARRVTSIECEALRELAALGYATSYLVAPALRRHETTPGGARALRVHRAWLASGGAP